MKRQIVLLVLCGLSFSVMAAEEPQSEPAKTHAELEKKLETALKNDPALSDRSKTVKAIVDEGFINLVGSVSSSHDRAEIEVITKPLVGTTRVINQTVIEPE